MSEVGIISTRFGTLRKTKNRVLLELPFKLSVNVRFWKYNYNPRPPYSYLFWGLLLIPLLFTVISTNKCNFR